MVARPAKSNEVSKCRLKFHLLSLVTLAAGSICLVSCGGGSSAETPSNPVPEVSSLSPAFALVDASDTTVTIMGAGFLSSSTVAVNGTTVKGTFVSSSQLTAVVPAADQTAVAKLFVTVINPAPGGGTSVGAEFDVVAAALNVTVMDLPAGAPGAVTVTRPDGTTLQLTGSGVATGPAGGYTVTAGRVGVGNSTYWAVAPSQTATVNIGKTGSVTVDYYDVVPNTTKALDQTGQKTLSVSPDGKTLTISNTSEVAQSLQTGDVLVSSPTPAIPHGLLVKVTSVTPSGSNVIVVTSPATLADEVARARISLIIPLVPSGSMSTLGHVGRKAIASPAGTNTLSNPCAGNASEFTIPVNASLPPDPNGDTINASGEVDLCAANLVFNIDTGTLSGTFSVTLQEYASAVAQGRYSIGFNQTIPLDASELEDQVICLGNGTCTAILGLADSIRNALDVVTPVLTPFIGFSGNANAGFYTGGAESGQFTAGFTLQNAQPGIIHSSSLQAVSDPSALDGSLSVKAFAGVTIGLEFFGSLTAHVDPDAYVQLNADTASNPWWNLVLGEEASTTITVSVLGFFSHDIPIAEFPIYSGVVAQATGPFSAQPTITAVSPASVMVGSPDLTLVVTGSNFVPGASVSFAGNQLQTTYMDPDDLTATLPAADLLMDGTLLITATNPDTSGATSKAYNFTVTGAIISVTPGTVSVPVGGTKQFTAKVTGPSNVNVTWSVNGVRGGNSTVGTINASGLYTAPAALPIPASATVTAASAAVPSVTGSAAVTLTNPPPMLTAVSPSSVVVGPFSLTVTGTGFLSGAQVYFGTAALTTTFVSSTQLTAVGTAAITQLGMVGITAKNPGTSASNAIHLTVLNVTGGGSGSTAIIPGQLNGQTVDEAYVPLPNVGLVSVVNVDAASGTNPVVTTIAMPSGYSPTATAANPAALQVFVISYTSGDIQVIDATKNQVTMTLQSGVNQSFTFSGGSCMICGMQVDPSHNEAILDTAQGYLLLDLTAFTFSSFIPAAPAENFGYDPNTLIAVSPKNRTASPRPAVSPEETPSQGGVGLPSES